MQRWRTNQNSAGEVPPDFAALSDEALVQHAQRNSNDFSHLYDRYWKPVFQYCYYRSGDWHDAEDAASQVFVNALNGLPRFRPGDGGTPFRCWLFAIAHNVVINAGSKSARRVSASLDHASAMHSPLPGPEELAIAAESHRYAHALLNEVRPEHRDLLELRLAGLTSVEIANVLGKSHGSVRTAQHRAIESLRHLMSIETSEIEESHA